MRWLASIAPLTPHIVVALCLVGAGAVRSERHLRGDLGDRAELSAASHVVAKLAPRRASSMPDHRLDAIVVVDRAGVLATRPPHVRAPLRGLLDNPPPSPELHVHRARGPPDRA